MMSTSYARTPLVIVQEVNSQLLTTQFSISSLKRTPASTRLISILLLICYILSCFSYGITDQFIDIPNVTYARKELYRIVVSPYFGQGIFTLLLSMYIFIPSGSRLEQSFGSISLLLMVVFLSIFINLLHDAVCFLVYFQTDNMASLYWSIYGFLPIALCLVTIDCCMDPAAPRYFLCIQLSSAFYPFFLLMFIRFFVSFEFPTMNALLALVVGYVCSCDCSYCFCCCCLFPLVMLLQLGLQALKFMEMTALRDDIYHQQHVSSTAASSSCWIPISHSIRYGGSSSTHANNTNNTNVTATTTAVGHIMGYTTTVPQPNYSSVLRNDGDNNDIEQQHQHHQLPSAPILSPQELSYLYDSHGGNNVSNTVGRSNGYYQQQQQSYDNVDSLNAETLELPVAILVTDDQITAATQQHQQPHLP